MALNHKTLGVELRIATTRWWNSFARTPAIPIGQDGSQRAAHRFSHELSAGTPNNLALTAPSAQGTSVGI